MKNNNTKKSNGFNPETHGYQPTDRQTDRHSITFIYEKIIIFIIKKSSTGDANIILDPSTTITSNHVSNPEDRLAASKDDNREPEIGGKPAELLRSTKSCYVKSPSGISHF